MNKPALLALTALLVACSEAPTITVVSGTTARGGVYVLAGSVSHPAGIASATFKLNDGLEEPLALVRGHFLVEVAVPVGESTIEVTAVSKNKKAGSLARKVNYADDEPPEVSLFASRSFFAEPGVLRLTAVATDDTAIERVEIYTGPLLVAELTSPPYVFEWEISATNNGSYDYVAKAFDAGGRDATSEPVSITVAIDAEPPQITFTSPDVAPDGEYVLTGSVTDNLGVDFAFLDAGGQFHFLERDPGGHFAVPLQLPLAQTVTLTVEARDPNGNYASKSLDVRSLDLTAPKVTLVVPTADVRSARSYTLRAEVEDNVGVAAVQFLRGSQVIATLASGPFEHTLVLDAQDNGEIVFSARAVDADENEAVDSVTVVVAINSPELEVTSGLVSYVTWYSLAGTASDPDGLAVLHYTLRDGAPVNLVLEDGAFAAVLVLEEGDNQIHLLAEDPFGNRTTKSLTVRYRRPTSLTVVAASPDLDPAPGAYTRPLGSETWIEFRLADAEGLAVPGARVRITSAFDESSPVGEGNDLDPDTAGLQNEREVQTDNAGLARITLTGLQWSGGSDAAGGYTAANNTETITASFQGLTASRAIRWALPLLDPVQGSPSGDTLFVGDSVTRAVPVFAVALGDGPSFEGLYLEQKVSPPNGEPIRLTMVLNVRVDTNFDGQPTSADPLASLSAVGSAISFVVALAETGSGDVGQPVSGLPTDLAAGFHRRTVTDNGQLILTYGNRQLGERAGALLVSGPGGALVRAADTESLGAGAFFFVKTMP